MMKLRDNKGLTLVELMVAITIGTMVVMAVTTVMLLGLRIYNKSNKEAVRQQNVRMAITMMEKLTSEAHNVCVTEAQDADEQTVYAVCCEEGDLLRCDGNAIITGAGVVILKDVETFEPTMTGDLLTISFTVEGIEEPYSFSVRCPIMQMATVSYAVRRESPEEILTNAIHDEALTPGVRAFLKVLASQVGSEGQILTDDGAGEYYSSWYIGGYETNPEWNEQTPWCGCFVSWALEECRGYIQDQTPRFANVDKFWAEFITSDSWKNSDPQPGEIIFFDWILDAEKNPEHVGVVISADENWIYTVEGNSNNLVKICKYSVENPYILGFGKLNWT